MPDKQQQIEMIGKVFVVTCGMRRCLICDGVFTPTQAANHATTFCYPQETSSCSGDPTASSVWKNCISEEMSAFA